jgi:hypothetical protein
LGIVERCCNGVTNKPLYKNNRSKAVKRVLGRCKINLETLKSYKICKAITDFIRYKLHFSKANSKIMENKENEE